MYRINELIIFLDADITFRKTINRIEICENEANNTTLTQPYTPKPDWRTQIGQDGCASPLLWALINRLLLTALDKWFTCIRLVAVYGCEEHVRPSDSFVDDIMCDATNYGTTI
jgi:hypothetical protein